MNSEAKTKIKQESLMTLGSAQQKAGTFASQVVAAIAAVELPNGEWQDLIEILLGFVNNQSNNANLKIATLQAIGFVCEQIVSYRTCVLAGFVLNTEFDRNLRFLLYDRTKS